MTIKDKLAHYEPKPLGEKGRYAVLLPLIYDVKTGKYGLPRHLKIFWDLGYFPVLNYNSLFHVFLI